MLHSKNQEFEHFQQANNNEETELKDSKVLTSGYIRNSFSRNSSAQPIDYGKIERKLSGEKIRHPPQYVSVKEEFWQTY